MTKIKKYVEGITMCALLLMSVMTGSCVQNLSIKGNKSSSIVVKCILTNSDVQKVSLYYESPFESLELLSPETANVKIIDVESGVGYDGEKTDYGEWSVAFRPEAGKEYSLEVNVDKKNIKAVTVFPAHTLKEYVFGTERDSDVAIIFMGTMATPHKKLFPDAPISHPEFLFYKDLDNMSEPELTLWIKRTDNLEVKVILPSSSIEAETMNEALVRTKVPGYFAIDADGALNYYKDRVTYIYMYNVSMSLDYYLADMYRQKKSNADLVNLLYSDSRGLYSNIDGGFGIFGAAEAFRIPCPEAYDYGRPDHLEDFEFIPE